MTAIYLLLLLLLQKSVLCNDQNDNDNSCLKEPCLEEIRSSNVLTPSHGDDIVDTPLTEAVSTEHLASEQIEDVHFIHHTEEAQHQPDSNIAVTHADSVNEEIKESLNTEEISAELETADEENDTAKWIRESNLSEFLKLGIVIPEDADKTVHEVKGSEKISESTPQKQQYFPFLYMFKSLVYSILSEFGDDSNNQESSFNGSEIMNENLTVSEDVNRDHNTTLNGTDINKKTRFQCAVKNISANATGEVKIVNSTELLEILNFSKNQKISTCVLVLFYAPWCHFCARTAPHYNALARAFPQLDVLAVDTSHFSYLNARFGTVAVPNVMLFHSRSAVRFNHTTRVFESFVQFVSNNTGLNPDKTVKLEPTDFVGPLPSVVSRGRDWLLWLSWSFVISCSMYGFVRSGFGQSSITRLRVLWQEHQHIE
ncbi:thioredoxin domain-containing protein 15-like [Physella acuta]|uniref:thioredoxin domain-containing protein 15-like n=1 Tax=Physella acuta TaxID=109671 RepID=UPI0027DB1154|nr:thioredoxin domain-containing protein 15-like [Physella acuta]XP_059156800.1 thioredoxin domain-containing protein 15-like [Physella acuta]XP_059156801.1 thioredoxin domain-containing protein 15-like [Physella acuta]XP_059156802.1 thioredoxin domain-containing protein 15-like [Physella acuta]XP_059156803.1 thioredoxin domain-containing protein 15-like [Physella acuta]XP_059156804.1 thioredoxin domain-containing protein 15-like [Physella acuta]